MNKEIIFTINESICDVISKVVDLQKYFADRYKISFSVNVSSVILVGALSVYDLQTEVLKSSSFNFDTSITVEKLEDKAKLEAKQLITTYFEND